LGWAAPEHLQGRQLTGIYPSFLAKFQPQFEFCLVDECELVPLARDRTDPTSILMASNQARNMDDFEKAVEQIDRLASDQGLRNLASQLLRWLLKVGRKGKLDLKVDPEAISLENLKENIVMLQENIHKFRHEDFEKGVVFGINQGREEGQLLGTLKTLLKFYFDGIVSVEQASSQMQALLGQGHDDLVKEYLQKLK